jgi:hypothetical protein
MIEFESTWDRMQHQQTVNPIPNVTTEYYPDYDWNSDPHSWKKKFYCGDLIVSAGQFWKGKYPGASWAIYNGQKRLGRWVTPVECEYWLRWTKWSQENMFIRALTYLFVAAALCFTTGGGLGGFVGGIIGAIIWTLPIGWFLAKKRHFRKLYIFWLEVQGKTYNAEKPVWVPFFGKQLRNVRRGGDYAWP